jgi:hypothetical protein
VGTVAFVCRHYGWDSETVWNEITFAQLLLYVEEMQSQQRAENGIKEIVLGYYGHELNEVTPPEQSIQEAVGQFNEAGAGPIKQVNMEDLPEHLQEILRAEQHRLKTGEIRKSTEFKK